MKHMYSTRFEFSKSIACVPSTGRIIVGVGQDSAQIYLKDYNLEGAPETVTKIESESGRITESLYRYCGCDGGVGFYMRDSRDEQ